MGKKLTIITLFVMSLLWMNTGMITMANTNAACKHTNMSQRAQTDNWTATHTVKLSESLGYQKCTITYTADKVYLYCNDCGHSVYLDTFYHEWHSICNTNN